MFTSSKVKSETLIKMFSGGNSRLSDCSQSLSLKPPPWNLISCSFQHAPSSGYAADLISQPLDLHRHTSIWNAFNVITHLRFFYAGCWEALGPRTDDCTNIRHVLCSDWRCTSRPHTCHFKFQLSPAESVNTAAHYLLIERCMKWFSLPKHHAPAAL